MSECKKPYKSLVLKLGGQCNLNCKYCHCKRVDFKFNSDIYKYIEDNGYNHIVFSGGEPLLYWNIIKEVIEHFGDSIRYRLVSNGNLLNKEIVDFLNEYDVYYCVSYDGKNNFSRDINSAIRWREFAKINNIGFATLYSYSNEDINKLLQDIESEINRYHLNINIGTRHINFPHSTNINKNDMIDRELAKKYCMIICRFLELDFIKLKSINDYKQVNWFKDFPVIKKCFERYIKKQEIRGVKCCNENITPMTIEGKFLLCPYDEQYVGDIYTGIDWDKVESYIPDRCKGCPQWKSCMNTCIANVTDNECYISKVIYKHFYKLMDKYNYDYNFMNEHITR